MSTTVHELYHSFEIKPIRSMTLLFLFAQITAFFRFIYSKSEDTSLVITKLSRKSSFTQSSWGDGGQTVSTSEAGGYHCIQEGLFVKPLARQRSVVMGMPWCLAHARMERKCPVCRSRRACSRHPGEQRLYIGGSFRESLWYSGCGLDVASKQTQ